MLLKQRNSATLLRISAILGAEGGLVNDTLFLAVLQAFSIFLENSQVRASAPSAHSVPPAPSCTLVVPDILENQISNSRERAYGLFI